MKKIVVFGGSGFLGSYIIDELINQGFYVVNADITPPKHNIYNQKYIECDILDIEGIKKVITGDEFAVYNFAGFADLEESSKRPIDTLNLNIIGNTNILEICNFK